MKFEPVTETEVTRDTATAPPRTAKLEMFAPPAVQLTKLQDEMATTEMFEPGNSTASAPPQLLEGVPVAPQATVTELLLKLQLLALKFDRATLFVYTAPPPPLAVPGRTDVELVSPEHLSKLEFEITTCKLNPVKFMALEDFNDPRTNSEICGI
jgi:hypothetical protein